MKTYEHQIRVTYQETDKMGVVYHANYLHWFEIARTEMLRAEGFSYKSLEKRGILLPVLEAHCNYHHPAYYDDLVTIFIKIKELRRTKISFVYEILNSKDQRLLTTGTTVHPFVNSSFKPISLKKELPELWDVIQINFDN